MALQIRPARRDEAKPLVGLYSESGCGKTWSSLMLARGFAPKGRIAMIEADGGRGEAYADMVDGGYDVIPLRGNYAPTTFGEAIGLAEQAKADVLIVDNASAEWEGVGGVLSMAADNQAAGRKGPIVWQRPKMDHATHFMLRLMFSPIPLVIVNMRARYPMIEAVVRGEKVWTRSTVLEPKQSDDILFEMFVHGWIDQQHAFHTTKYSRPDLREVFIDGEPISIETGARLAVWAGRSLPGTAPPVASPPAAVQAGGADLTEMLRQYDETLTQAAKHGKGTLAVAWGLIPKDYKPHLKSALDRRHKPAAEAVDLQTQTGEPNVDA